MNTIFTVDDLDDYNEKINLSWDKSAVTADCMSGYCNLQAT